MPHKAAPESNEQLATGLLQVDGPGHTDPKLCLHCCLHSDQFSTCPSKHSFEFNTNWNNRALGEGATWNWFTDMLTSNVGCGCLSDLEYNAVAIALTSIGEYIIINIVPDKSYCSYRNCDGHSYSNLSGLYHPRWCTSETDTAPNCCCFPFMLQSARVIIGLVLSLISKYC